MKQSMLNKKKEPLVRHMAKTIASVLILRILLDFIYVNYVHRYFGGPLTVGAFPLAEINPLRMLESYVLVFFLAWWLSSSLSHRWRLSGVALVLYFTFVMIPLSSLYGLADASPAFTYAATVSFAVLLIVTGLLPRVKVPRLGHDFLALGTLMLIGMSIYVYGLLLITGGLGRMSFDLLSVYEVRAEFVQARAPFIGYFVPWQANVINITLLAYGLNKRRIWLIGFAGIAQLLIFGMTGHKSFLLAPILAAGVYLIWRLKNALLYIFGGAAVVASASYLLFLISGNHLAPSLLIRRLFFVPALNHLIYYDFFSQPDHPFVMLSNSILKGFVRYPYDMPIPEVIAQKYWARDFWPNVGYLGDAFANFGFMGMFLFSVILGLFLRFVDSVAAQLPTNLAAAVVAVPAMALVNSALFTSLLTHGLILASLIIWLLQAVEKRRPNAAQNTTLCMSIAEIGGGQRLGTD